MEREVNISRAIKVSGKEILCLLFFSIWWLMLFQQCFLELVRQVSFREWYII